MKSHRNVCGIIVRNDVCIGCGICAGICPADVLAMQFNQYGEYVPVEQNEECTAYMLCFFVCPFWNQTENQADEDALAQAAFSQEPGIQHRLES